MSGTVLILGATGRFGRHAAEAFWNAGWRVRVFDRAEGDLVNAAMGADVIVNAWNPAHDRWEDDLPHLTQRVIDAAQASGATVLIPSHLNPARHRLERVRIGMEDTYRRSGVRTIILRSGDFIDTEPTGTRFDRVAAAKLHQGVVIRPDRADAAHHWAYLPDLARAAVALAERREFLERFEDVSFTGYALTFDKLTELLSSASGRTLRQRAFPGWAVLPMLPVWNTGRHLFGGRSPRSMPRRIDGSRFDALVPGFRQTPPLIAIAAAIRHQIDPDNAVARGTLDLAAQ